MIKILCADALEGLRTLPNDSVSMCVTSPPYYGLRDYGNAGQIGIELNLVYCKKAEERIASV